MLVQRAERATDLVQKEGIGVEDRLDDAGRQGGGGSVRQGSE